MELTDYKKEQLKKIATFLRSISTPTCKSLSYTDSSIALVSAKYIEIDLLEEKNESK